MVASAVGRRNRACAGGLVTDDWLRCAAGHRVDTWAATIEAMDDIVAVRAETDAGQVGFWLTWARVFDAIDPDPMIAAIRPHLRLVDQRGELAQVRVCLSLQEAASQPYFYEGMWSLGQTKIPFASGYEEWKAEKRMLLSEGRDLCYLGDPDPAGRLK